MDLFRQITTTAVTMEKKRKSKKKSPPTRSQPGITIWKGTPQSASDDVVNWYARTCQHFSVRFVGFNIDSRESSVLVSWMCKKQSAVSPQCRARNISLDEETRMECLPAFYMCGIVQWKLSYHIVMLEETWSVIVARVILILFLTLDNHMSVDMIDHVVGNVPSGSFP